ncbi:hypothetical protein PIB30_008309 [Stylosanthes scabra]|uniref:Interferon-related developmental regulator N-terminal domain-containing protein n=1 Tax=Stylosanthes scabra TaxID=79078 RepID=A0ABU6S540_9FABA|nr:hypothetical protein [Stylosanthes scabra]
MVGIKRVKAHLTKRKGRYDEVNIDDDRDRAMLRWVPVSFVTYLCQVLDCLRKGLTKEKQLASQALGLLAITLSETENSDEIYRYTISLVTELLRVPNKVISTPLEDKGSCILTDWREGK